MAIIISGFYGGLSIPPYGAVRNKVKAAQSKTMKYQQSNSQVS